MQRTRSRGGGGYRAPPCHDKEALLLGFNTRNKSLILGAYLVIPVVHLARAEAWTGEALASIMATVGWQWFVWTLAVVAGRIVYLMWAHNVWRDGLVRQADHRSADRYRRLFSSLPAAPVAVTPTRGIAAGGGHRCVLTELRDQL